MAGICTGKLVLHTSTSGIGGCSPLRDQLLCLPMFLEMVDILWLDCGIIIAYIRLPHGLDIFQLDGVKHILYPLDPIFKVSTSKP